MASRAAHTARRLLVQRLDCGSNGRPDGWSKGSTASWSNGSTAGQTARLLVKRGGPQSRPLQLEAYSHCGA